MSSYVSLHNHTEYSLLDGLTKIKDLVARAKDLEMPAIAITDHGTMYGAIEFYKECLAQNIKPLVGIEAYTVPENHRRKESKEDKVNNHLVLLAKNLTGYQNLLKISTISHLEGFYYKPRIDLPALKKYSAGLICLSACPKGEIGHYLISGDPAKAKEQINWYLETFGKENYFLEIQRHQYKDYFDSIKENARLLEKLQNAQRSEDIWLDGVIKFSREFAVPLVATNDSHYLNQSDALAQDVLVCISTGKNLPDIERLRYVDAPTFHLRDQKEMTEIFPDFPDAVANTAKVAELCDLKIELGKWFFPKIALPENITAADQLRQLARQGLKDKNESDRLEYELKVIIDKGYAAYFLMMADLVNWCTQNGIVTNTRGSAAGSLVSYSLGITNVDPIKYGLPFERFLNPFRPKPPDIDLDVADNRREEVIKYITQKYGQEKVAQICTFGRMLSRAAVRDVGRVLGFPYSYPDIIAKIIPQGSQGFPINLKRAMETSPELKALYDTEPDAKKLINLSCEIEGNARHASVHAAGVVVSPGLMTDLTPLQYEPKGEKIITQYEMHACEDVGLVKFDILGIRNLSILQSAVEIIEEKRGVKINLTQIPLDDKKTFIMLAKGNTMGTFQLGGAGMTKWLVELKPNRVEDLMVMVALFRPGPIANIPDFIARKNQKQAVKYLHPKMKNFLEKSYGVLVYQEDILFTAIEIAGYDWETVDTLRQAIGKKKPKEMAQQHEIFVAGCQKTSGLTPNEAEKLWELFVPFQGYGFNKAHAASYGLVAYQTSYLKAHYPVEYMTALLTAESADADKIAAAVEECKHTKILILPPDINKSAVGFTIEENADPLDHRAIRFGLSAIKNIGAAAIESIFRARQGGPFISISDFARRVDLQKVNRKTLESLIKAGALDIFGKRAAMLAVLDRLITQSHKLAKQVTAGQGGLFGETSADDFTLPNIDETPRDKLLQEERELLGFYLTEHPLSKSLDKIGGIIEDPPIGKIITISGMITSLRKVFTKKNNEEMAFVTLQGRDGAQIDGVVFPKIYRSGDWKENTVMVCTGKLDHRDEKLSLVIDRAQKIE